MKTIFFLTALLAGSAAQADTQYWDYKDWRVMVETVDTGEDLRITCTALTGGDGDPTLSVILSNGDAGPPDFYPQPTLSEHAIRGYNSMMQDGARVLFEADTGWLTEGFVNGGINEDGFAEAFAQANQGDSLEMLQTMRKAGKLFVTLDGEVVYAASLSGFTASYGKIAEQCGFSTEGVL